MIFFWQKFHFFQKKKPPIFLFFFGKCLATSIYILFTNFSGVIKKCHQLSWNVSRDVPQYCCTSKLKKKLFLVASQQFYFIYLFIYLFIQFCSFESVMGFSKKLKFFGSSLPLEKKNSQLFSKKNLLPRNKNLPQKMIEASLVYNSCIDQMEILCDL